MAYLACEKEEKKSRNLEIDSLWGSFTKRKEKNKRQKVDLKTFKEGRKLHKDKTGNNQSKKTTKKQQENTQRQEQKQQQENKQTRKKGKKQPKTTKDRKANKQKRKSWETTTKTTTPGKQTGTLQTNTKPSTQQVFKDTYYTEYLIIFSPQNGMLSNISKCC